VDARDRSPAEGHCWGPRFAPGEYVLQGVLWKHERIMVLERLLEFEEHGLFSGGLTVRRELQSARFAVVFRFRTGQNLSDHLRKFCAASRNGWEYLMVTKEPTNAVSPADVLAAPLALDADRDFPAPCLSNTDEARVLRQAIVDDIRRRFPMSPGKAASKNKNKKAAASAAVKRVARRF
jgi:hypothetical protein